MNWEKGADGSLGARSATLVVGETVDESALLPVSIRGEVPGRAMRGSANAGKDNRQFLP
ncbi:conserved hypothetical protein [Mesorhizobium prunaredense]|uniref:Uncharacterized protein n=1 Tax=Mesorhizobium prunaredense TaxID=1631249 RepID=A0A1R3VIG2_9HYPH|nr:conserved hypothetical protein [Mesorhizobium prunaredense]